MNGWADLAAFISYNYFISASLLGIGIAYSFNCKHASCYFLIISLDFILTNIMHGAVLALDPDKIYRYLIWSVSEFILLAVVIYLALVNGKIEHYIATILGLLITISIFALLYRAIDRHLIDLPYAHDIITNLPVFSNFSRVVLGFLPLIVLINKFFKRKFNDHFNNNNDGDIFHARDCFNRDIS